MSDPFIIDSSVGIGWVHPSQASELTKQLLDEAKGGAAIYVPSLWHLEIANTLLVFVRRKLITEAQREVGLTLLSQLRIIIDDETNRLGVFSHFRTRGKIFPFRLRCGLFGTGTPQVAAPCHPGRRAEIRRQENRRQAFLNSVLGGLAKHSILEK